MIEQKTETTYRCDECGTGVTKYNEKGPRTPNGWLKVAAAQGFEQREALVCTAACAVDAVRRFTSELHSA